MKKKTVVIIDGYSTAKSLVYELNLKKINCIHVESVENPPQSLAAALNCLDYSEVLGYIGDKEQAANIISEYDPIAVVAGSEPGVEHAEAIGLRLGLPTNAPYTASARRNKFLMGEYIRQAGLKCAQQIIVDSVENALLWTEQQNSWPIVLKPLNSAGSDGVTICSDQSEVECAVKRTINQVNLLGLTNDILLAQTYLDGPQYLVNGVSLDGIHTFTDIWLFNIKEVPGYSIAMTDWVLVDPNEPKIEEIIQYTRRALDALGIKNGASHSEVRYTSNGPHLIETAARLCGVTMEREGYIEAGLYGSQATAWALSIAEPEEFKSRWWTTNCYEFRKHFAKSFFVFDEEGIVKDISGLLELQFRPSWYATYNSLSVGSFVPKTTNTVGIGGVVYWINEKADVFDDDRIYFRKLDDENRLYCV